MKTVTVLLPDRLIELIDEVVRDGWYPSRSSLIRSAIRDVLLHHLEANRIVKSGGRAFMKLITLHVPPTYLEALSILVDRGIYPNRAEAIRDGIRRLLESYGITPNLNLNKSPWMVEIE